MVEPPRYMYAADPSLVMAIFGSVHPCLCLRKAQTSDNTCGTETARSTDGLSALAYSASPAASGPRAALRAKFFNDRGCRTDDIACFRAAGPGPCAGPTSNRNKNAPLTPDSFKPPEDNDWGPHAHVPPRTASHRHGTAPVMPLNAHTRTSFRVV